MKMVQILRRQRLDVSAEGYEHMKADRRDKNVANAIDILTKAGISFDQSGRHGRDQLLTFSVYKPPALYSDERPEKIVYYPEIGKWYDLDWKVKFGCRNLVKYLLGEQNA